MTPSVNGRPDPIRPPPGGWFWIDNRAVDRIVETGRLAFAVYVVLSRFTNKDRECFVTMKRLAETVGASTRAVRGAIRNLVEAELVTIREERDQTGRSRANHYRVLPLSPSGEAEVEFLPGGSGVPGRRKLSSGGGGTGVPPEQDVLEQDVLNKTKKGGDSRKGRKAEDVPIPAGLDSPKFREAWAEWLAYRRERRLTLSRRTLAAQLDKLAEWGTRGALDAIRASISNGWAGIFNQQGKENGKPNRTGAGPGQRHDPSRQKPADHDIFTFK